MALEVLEETLGGEGGVGGLDGAQIVLAALGCAGELVVAEGALDGDMAHWQIELGDEAAGAKARCFPAQGDDAGFEGGLGFMGQERGARAWLWRPWRPSDWKQRSHLRTVLREQPKRRAAGLMPWARAKATSWWRRVKWGSSARSME